MAKHLWLLRHAKAVEHPPPGGRDRDRKLSSRGERDAEALGAVLRSAGLGHELPDYVVSSPASRTYATATRAFHQLAPAVPIATDQRLYRATPDDVLEIVRQLPDEVQCACVVGHNPTIHCLSLDLVAEAIEDEPHPGAAQYPPGTLSVIMLPVGSWAKCSWGEGRLEHFWTPPRER
jgi:phosphohistidine phosphatase